MHAVVNRLLSVSEVARWLGVSPAWVRDHASGRRRPILPSVKLGKLMRFRPTEVERFIETCSRSQESKKVAA